MIRTFDLPREWREFGDQADLLDAFRKLCETTLDHPGLARPLAHGSEGNIPYLVYADLEGTAMDAVMKQDGPRPVAEVLRRATQLAEAIDSAAGAGVHHGLLAPSDVILNGERTGVTGFGLAQALIKAGMSAEAIAPYGSPQRIAGAPPTRADDIYSLAAITLELLIGTPADPSQDTSRALREAQGLPERRRVPRPAPHETRLFTTIAGVDAGKLRAAFASAFSDEPGDRPSTASDFVARFEDALANRRATDELPRADEPATSVAEEVFVSEEREEPLHVPAAVPALDVKRSDDQATLELPFREQLLLSDTPKPRPQTRVARPEPMDRSEPTVDVPLLGEARPLPATFMESYSVPVRSHSRVFVVALLVGLSFAAGFGGGFVVGQRSTSSTESTGVTRREPVAEPPPAPAAGEPSKPVASTAQTPPPTSSEKVASSDPIAAPAAPAAPPPAAPAVETGRLLVRSTPAGAGVLVDGQSRGVTPLDLRELAFGTYTVEVSHPGHDSRRQRVTLSARRPQRSLDVALRTTNVPERVAAATKATGSLQVLSRPSGAQVFVDDTLVGTTPFLLSDVAAGSRRLKIEMSGYKTWTTSVQIEPSARSRIAASLEP